MMLGTTFGPSADNHKVGLRLAGRRRNRGLDAKAPALWEARAQGFIGHLDGRVVYRVAWHLVEDQAVDQFTPLVMRKETRRNETVILVHRNASYVGRRRPAR